MVHSLNALTKQGTSLHFSLNLRWYGKFPLVPSRVGRTVPSKDGTVSSLQLEWEGFTVHHTIRKHAPINGLWRGYEDRMTGRKVVWRLDGFRKNTR